MLRISGIYLKMQFKKFRKRTTVVLALKNCTGKVCIHCLQKPNSYYYSKLSVFLTHKGG